MAGFVNSNGRLIQYSDEKEYSQQVSTKTPPIVCINREDALILIKALVEYEKLLPKEKIDKLDENGNCLSMAINGLADQINGVIYK